MVGHVGTFRSAETRANFLQAFDTAMAPWPDRTDQRVETSFGSTVASTTRGSGGGDPLVLLQGGGSTIAAWAQFADAWRHERPVVAIDTVWDAGRGRQRRPVLTGADAAIWLDETLSALAIDTAHIVGYSYGGWVALNQAVECPSRLLSVTAIEPPGTLTRIPLRAWWRMGAMLLGGEQQYRRYLGWVRGGQLPDSSMMEVMVSARRDFDQRGSPRPRVLSTEQWRSIRTPHAIVLGARSRFVPTRAATAVVRRDSPRAQLRVLPDAGHAALVDEPGVVIEAVRDFADCHDRTTR